MIFIKDSYGNVIGEIVEESTDGVGNCLFALFVILILGVTLVAAVVGLPVFIEFYAQIVYTYLIAVGIIGINILLFYNDTPIVTVIKIETIILALVLFIHNMWGTNSCFNFLNEDMGGMIEKVLVLITMIWQCVLGSFLLCVICSVVSGICTLILEKKKKEN